MRPWLKPLLLCLLAAKPLTCFSAVIAVSDDQMRYPGEAAPEERLVVYGEDSGLVRPSGWFDGVQPNVLPTHSFWFDTDVSEIGRLSVVYNEMVITNRGDVIVFSADAQVLQYQLSHTWKYGNMLPVSWQSDGTFHISGNIASSLIDGMGYLYAYAGGMVRPVRVEASVSLPGYTGYVEHLEQRVFPPGSLKEHVNTNMLALIDGQDGSEGNLAIYSLQDHAATNYVRNTNCWAYSLDMTCKSPWNSTGDGANMGQRGLPSGQGRAATLITPKHMLVADHYHMRQTWEGSNRDFEVRFVDMDNNVYHRTAVAYKKIVGHDPSVGWVINTNHVSLPPYEPSNENAASDFGVIRLNEELPSSIRPAMRFPDDWYKYAPPSSPAYLNSYDTGRRNENFPILQIDANGRATIAESSGVGFWIFVSGSDGFDPSRGWYFMRRNNFNPFWRQKIVGDSGSPCIMFVNGNPVLLTTLTTTVSGLFSTPFAMGKIQQAIYDFGDTNIWEAVDLSAFVQLDMED